MKIMIKNKPIWPNIYFNILLVDRSLSDHQLNYIFVVLVLYFCCYSKMKKLIYDAMDQEFVSLGISCFISGYK